MWPNLGKNSLGLPFNSEISLIKPHKKDEQLLKTILHGIDEVKGENIVALDLRHIENCFADYFIICEGTSNTHINAIASSIERTVRKKLKQRPFHVEGEDNALWILMDYSNVIVHVFDKQTREFYDIESLWGDAIALNLTT